MKAQTQYNKDCVGSLHFYNKEERRGLNIFVNGQALLFRAEPTYLGIKMDTEFTFRRHLESLSKKLTSRVGVLKAIGGIKLGYGCHRSPHSHPCLGHSTAEYCAPVWCCSAHTCLIDKPTNDVLRIVTADVCVLHQRTTFLFYRAFNKLSFAAKKLFVFSSPCSGSRKFLYERLLSLLGGQPQQLKSRHPFVPGRIGNDERPCPVRHQCSTMGEI